MLTHSGSNGSAETGLVDAAVRNFYEQHPYPQPVDDLDRYERHRHDAPARRAEHHLLWPGSAYREDHSILIAGCGTSQAAKHALRWPHARVTGIDVSTESIRRTEALKIKHGLDNLELRELPVECAQELGQSFDQVVCTGVLHHLTDPDAGLRALRQVLAPGGAMHLMVYAPYGRAGVYLLQEYCRRVGIGTSAEEIRDLGAVLRELPRDHPLRPLLGKSPDFSNESGLADALLHPQDRPYSVPQLLEFIARCGLKFGRWLRQAPYLPWCGAPLHSPHHSRLARLRAEDQYAAMELFRGTMVRHSAIVHRDDEPRDGQAIGQVMNFDDGAWLDYTAIRVPEAICVEERLPPGAAGVLINRNHTDTDIYLPIDAAQKRLYSAIDGRRSIRELLTGDTTTEAARGFFERLWWHDLVVFDSSQSEALRSMERGI
jgi:SAM-dependent methyltransferase